MTAPHNLVAEKHLLGAMLISSNAVDVAHRVVTADEFYSPAHKILFQAIVDVWLSGAPPNVVAVTEHLRTVTDPHKPKYADVVELDRNAGQTTDAAVKHYAEIVVEHATLRSLQIVGQRIVERASALADSVGLVEEAHDWLSALARPAGDADPGPDLDSFLAEKADTDWLVPGFLERTDRLILTGGEGRGKSTCLRQAGVQMAAGIVPFTQHSRCEPCRVLVVDCENPRGKLQRQLQPLRDRAGSSLDPARFVCLPRERGIDLDHRSDRRWFEERVRSNKPDVVITGPIYKLHAADPNEERPAARLRDFFDDLRTRYGFALLLEAHQPYASGANRRPMRPYGASLWSRWPDMGLCLMENDKQWVLGEWRGMREDRPAWPSQLTRQSNNKGQPWPWMVAAREGVA